MNSDFQLMVFDTFKEHKISINVNSIEVFICNNFEQTDTKITFHFWKRPDFNVFYTIQSCGLKFPNTEIKPNYEKETLSLIKQDIVPKLLDFYKAFSEISLLKSVDIVSYLRNIKLNELISE